MKKRLLYALLVAGFALVALTAVTTDQASAEKRTFQVRLADQSIVTITLDVPPGTPLNLIPLPGVLIQELPSPSESPAPNVEVPTPQLPTPPSGGGNEPTPSQPGAPSGNGSSGGDKNGGKKDDDEPSSRGGREQDRSGSSRGADSDESNSQDEGEGSSKKSKKRKKARKKKTRLRRPDGSPTRTNPGFFDALPGPTTVEGVPNFVIRKFRVPLFLLPIYQAAGIEYGIRWEYLAAINEIETDYGRNLNVSSAGALGWMQFMPATWKSYGVDANDDKKKDPYNPVDAIFAAARYLKAAGAPDDMRKAIFAYNHADWYVDSVVLRARLIAGLPADLVGSLTGLTEGRFPVAARAQYADDLAEQKATKKVKRGQNAANIIDSDDNRRSLDIFAKQGSPVVAVNDGVIKRIGKKKSDGSLYIKLQDAYGNLYTYENVGSVSKYYPVPKDEAGDPKREAKAMGAHGEEKADPKPTQAASAGRQPEKAAPSSDAKKVRVPAANADPRPQAIVKQRLFANPARDMPQKHGGVEQVFDRDQKAGGKKFETYRNYFSRGISLDSRDAKLKRLKKGSRVIAGTVLGRVGAATEEEAAHLSFMIRPAGRGAPSIDPKPILDGWKLLESTAIYRASGKNALYGEDGDGFSIGQILLLPKPMLEKRVLSDERIEIYPGGRTDIKTGQIDRRVLATLEFLAESGMRPTVTSLKGNHGYYTASGNVSAHSSGNAVDIAQINGIPILGHQDKGGITEQTVKRLMQLQGTVRPDQIISLLDFGQNTLPLSDHDDHIHVGFRPLFGNNSKLGKQAFAVLKPGQWNDLIGRLKEIENPVVPIEPSKYALPVRERQSDAHVGE